MKASKTLQSPKVAVPSSNQARGKQNYIGVQRKPRGWFKQARGYIGVQKKRWGSFGARIRDPSQNNKQKWLGSFKTDDDAARAYNKAASVYRRNTTLNVLPDGKEEDVEGDYKDIVKKEEPGGDYKDIVKKEESGGDYKDIVKKEESGGDYERERDYKFTVKEEPIY
ncbi:hypothetical protein ACJRO7_019442 [Eucalyptus globulus]|uniref:AP2/ERF domain-containing protein n=1 Tax=Eucalyptus globulus TaxID=34317 RepID=A0ABD3KIJ9_EUCGL